MEGLKLDPTVAEIIQMTDMTATSVPPNTRIKVRSLFQKVLFLWTLSLFGFNLFSFFFIYSSSEWPSSEV